MNRIKYPEKQEIKRQIRLILDESGMFEEGDGEKYAECVQVKKKPGLKTAVLFPLAAAAVMCVIVTAVGMLPKPAIPETEPMTNVLTDDTIRTVTKTNLNQNINVEIYTDTHNVTESEELKDTAAEVEFSYSYPKVYYQGEEVTAVTQYYVQKIRQLEKNAEEKYQDISSSGRQTDEESGAPIKISYHCSAVSGLTAEGSNLVTIYENYSENVRHEDGYTTVNEVYGSNFDAQTGRRLAMTDIFTDAQAGLVQVAGLLKKNVPTADLQHIIDSGAWYLGQEGLTLCVNGIVGEEKIYPDIRCRNIYSKTYVIAYSQLTELKQEYGNP